MSRLAEIALRITIEQIQHDSALCNKDLVFQFNRVAKASKVAPSPVASEAARDRVGYSARGALFGAIAAGGPTANLLRIHRADPLAELAKAFTINRAVFALEPFEHALRARQIKVRKLLG